MAPATSGCAVAFADEEGGDGAGYDDDGEEAEGGLARGLFAAAARPYLVDLHAWLYFGRPPPGGGEGLAVPAFLAPWREQLDRAAAQARVLRGVGAAADTDDAEGGVIGGPAAPFAAAGRAEERSSSSGASVCSYT